MKRLIATGLVVAAALNLWAQAPEMFRYQGRLASGATLVNATLPMSFKLYNAPNGGTKLYEDSNSVAVVNGLYSTYVGDNTVFGSLTNAMTNAAVYLELTISGETLSPRERLVSVPYALNAGASSANQTPAGTIVLSPTYPNPELAAQGYSIYQEDVTTADWQEISGRYPWPDMGGMDQLFIGHNNRLWALANDMGGEPSAFTTADGKQWTTGKLPVDEGYSVMLDEMYVRILSHGNQVFVFEKMMRPGRRVWTSMDGQVWNVQSNTINEMTEISDFVSFKGALWSFGVSNDPEAGSVSVVLKSTDGVNWTQMSTGSWSRIESGAQIVTSADQMWIIATALDVPETMVWRSTDGISWTQSAVSLPSSSYFYGSRMKSISFDNKLWYFDYQNRTCWNSSNHGDSWSVITTNLPEMQPEGIDGPIVHEGKLWVEGNVGPMGTPTVYRSTNGSDWILANAFNNSTATDWGLELISSDNGRLWWVCMSSLRIIGGPKQKDGLYYYQKD